MPTATVGYSTSTPTITITLVSLASSTALNSGRESDDVTSSAYGAMDYLVGGIVTTSSSGSTAGRQIEIWAYGTWNAGTTFSGGCTGVDAALTFASEKTQLKLLTVIGTDATATHNYEWGPCSIANAFGGVPPQMWGLWFGHNTGAALNATASNQNIQFTPIYFKSS